jgi:hypothetical protein
MVPPRPSFDHLGGSVKDAISLLSSVYWFPMASTILFFKLIEEISLKA